VRIIRGAMTDAEKQRMLAIVRAIESLYFENCALKTVLITRKIPQRIYERDVARLLKDSELVSRIHARFAHLYAEIEQAPDEAKVLEELFLSRRWLHNRDENATSL